MAYTKTEWVNDKAPAINAGNLNNIENGIEEAHNFINNLYSVGDLFLSTNSDNPSTKFGGVWELYGKGRTLVCVDEDDSDFNTVKKTGGEKTHKLTFNEMPAHAHNLNAFTNGSGSAGRFTGNYEWSSTSSDTESTRWIGDTTTEGSGQPHNNLQPYITCYIWIRVK